MWVSEVSGFEWWWLLPLICLAMMFLCFFGRGRHGRTCCGGIRHRGNYRAGNEHSKYERG